MPTISPIPLEGISIKTEIDKKSIAVLPFTNRSSDPENDYLCDGIAEELLTGLARLSELTVASQLLSFAFKGQVQDVQAIGRTLSTAHVLTGSVQKSGQRVRITATLTETGNGNVLWSERYDGNLDDVFELQENVATKVVEALTLELTSSEAGPIIKPGTTHQAAYQAFLLGRFEFGKGTRQSRFKAHEQFQEAYRLDPEFGLAFQLDFATLSLQRDEGHIAQSDYYPKAKYVLDRMRKLNHQPPVPAIVQNRWLDPALVEKMGNRTWAVNVLVALKDRDPEWQGAEYMELGRILAGAGLLHGSCDFVGHYLTHYATQALDGPSGTRYGNELFALGRFDKAIEHLSSIIAHNPDHVLNLGVRAMLYSRTGQYAKAKTDLDELTKTFPRNFAQFYDLYWRRELDAANAYFDWMEKQKNLSPLFKIWGCFLLGHIDKGLDYLETVNHTPYFLRVMCLYALTPSIIRVVTDHPRYQAFLVAQGSDNLWRDELLDMVNEVKHITGIHVSLDDDY